MHCSSVAQKTQMYFIGPSAMSVLLSLFSKKLPPAPSINAMHGNVRNPEQPKLSQKRTKLQCFPGGAVVENLPANAGHTGSCPGLGGSHMPRSGWACEPRLLSLRVWSPCSSTGEAAIVRGLSTAMRSGPRLLQLEKALAQKRRPNTAIK